MKPDFVPRNRLPELPRRKAMAFNIDRLTFVGNPARERYRNPIEPPPERKEDPANIGDWCGVWVNATESMELRQWTMMLARLDHARETFFNCVEINPLIRSGVPVVKGTRMPVATVLANVSADMNLSQIADDFELNKESLVLIFQCLSTVFDRPSAHEHHSARRVRKFQTVSEIVCPGRQDSDTPLSEDAPW